MEGATVHYLQQLTVCFYWINMAPSKRSIKYFGFLIGEVYGSSVKNDEQIRDTRCGHIKAKGRAETLPFSHKSFLYCFNSSPSLIKSRSAQEN
jgi:hypothetical protein